MSLGGGSGRGTKSKIHTTSRQYSFHIIIKRREIREKCLDFQRAIWYWFWLKGVSDITKTISIIVAAIIILTAGVNTELMAAAKPTQAITASARARHSPHKNKKKKSINTLCRRAV